LAEYENNDEYQIMEQVAEDRSRNNTEVIKIGHKTVRENCKTVTISNNMEHIKHQLKTEYSNLRNMSKIRERANSNSSEHDINKTFTSIE
jgi:hypothetical protein